MNFTSNYKKKIVIVIEFILNLSYKFREALRIQKLLRIKCKEMLTQSDGKIYEGIMDTLNMNLWPAPLKIIQQIVDSMKQFRVRIILILKI